MANRRRTINTKISNTKTYLIMENSYKSATKAGRCFNGAHRDSGVIVHAIPNKDINGPNMSKSLCGTKPGLRGYGWSDSNKEINCQNCLNKISKSNSQSTNPNL